MYHGSSGYAEIGFLPVLSVNRAEADMENRGYTGDVSDSPVYSTTVVQRIDIQVSR